MMDTLEFAVKLDAAQQLRVDVVRLADIGDASLAEWKSLEASSEPDSPMQDPEWLRGYFPGELDQISCYLIYRDGSLCGSASFLLKDWPLELRIGEIGVGRFPLHRLRLLGAKMNLPQDEKTYDRIFGQIASSQSGWNTLYFEQIPVESFLWKYLTTGKLISESFRTYIPERPSIHPQIRLGDSFDEYMKKFNKTHRHTLRRKVSRFQEESPEGIKLVRYNRPEEVDSFLKDACEVSKKTYQWQLLGRGLSKTELIRKRLYAAAERGWFRSYLLFRGDIPCAFLAGYQWRGRYYTDEIGFDPALAKHSPGTVLQVLWLQDLFAHNRPEMVDFGSYDKYKEEFSNESFDHGSLFLFRPSAYSILVRAGDSACRQTTRALARIFSELKLKSRLKKALRRWDDAKPGQ